MNLFEYQKIGPEILTKCEIERKMAPVVIDAKYSKSKECRQVPRGFVYKKHTSAAYMIRLTFV